MKNRDTYELSFHHLKKKGFTYHKFMKLLTNRVFLMVKLFFIYESFSPESTQAMIDFKETFIVSIQKTLSNSLRPILEEEKRQIDDSSDEFALNLKNVVSLGIPYRFVMIMKNTSG